MRRNVVRYGAIVRGVWLLPQRSEHEKVALINALSSSVHEMLFGPIWRRVQRFAIARAELGSTMEPLKVSLVF